MVRIEIAAVPNQSFTIALGGVRYAVALKAGEACMAATIARDGVPVVTGQRVVARSVIIPYPYLAEDGNFFIDTENDELPDWRQFGVTQFLYFATAAELAGG